MNYKKSLIYAFLIISFLLITTVIGISVFIHSRDKQTDENKVSINLFYYNPSLDVVNGNIECSDRGLVLVSRMIPKSNSIIEDTIRLLLEGNLTSKEIDQGMTSEFPLKDLSLKEAVLLNGILTLTFNDPNNQSSGGSCRTSILLAQVVATASQFEGVNQVNILPNEAFQP